MLDEEGIPRDTDESDGGPACFVTTAIASAVENLLLDFCVFSRFENALKAQDSEGQLADQARAFPLRSGGGGRRPSLRR